MPASIVVTGFLDVVLLVDSMMVSPQWRLAVTMANAWLSDWMEVRVGSGYESKVTALEDNRQRKADLPRWKNRPINIG